MQLVSDHPLTYDLTIIVPVFNEQESLTVFHNTLCEALSHMPGEMVQLIYINDGSRDDSWTILQALQCSFADVYRINLSRNFGKEAAMTAGLDASLGDAVTILDADLQDPPDRLSDMLKTLRQGFDVVNMKRKTRSGESAFKLFCARHYYRLLHWISDTPLETEVGDFRMLSRRVVDAINELPEKNRYMKGIMSWPGFKQTTLLFDRPKRVAGKSKWSLFQLCGLALSGITAFSVKPLRLATLTGALVSAGAFFYGLSVLTKTLIFGEAVAGYPSLMLALLFIGGAQLLGIGILGEYLGRVFLESKARPIYWVMDNEFTPMSKATPANHEQKIYG